MSMVVLGKLRMLDVFVHEQVTNLRRRCVVCVQTLHSHTTVAAATRLLAQTYRLCPRIAYGHDLDTYG